MNDFEHLDALEGLQEIKSVMTFLTKNRIFDGANKIHGVMVTWVNHAIGFENNDELILEETVRRDESVGCVLEVNTIDCKI